MIVLLLGRNGQVGSELVEYFSSTADVVAFSKEELDIERQDDIEDPLKQLC